LPGGPIEQALFISGPLVASVIWPIITGLYWRHSNKWFVIAAMLLGTGVGLWSYFAIGWFVGTLVSATVSMLVTVVGAWLFPQDFDWSKLNEGDEASPRADATAP
jgi:Na+/pantothenate symporter